MSPVDALTLADGLALFAATMGVLVWLAVHEFRKFRDFIPPSPEPEVIFDV